MTGFTALELERLLDRPIRRLLRAEDETALTGSHVLITGAGGSIGSELARVLARCEPGRLTLVDQCELNLFQIERELRERHPDLDIEPVLGDVTRGTFVRQTVRRARPHVVYHAAAYKHVTMVERAVCQALAVNVLGTAVVAGAARDVGARFVLISSDKAAAPQSVMGATKRLAELLVTADASPAFRPVVVRFGNVLGSSGSVLTIMRDHIRRGVPLPITDPEATRYFMTAGEAVSLVLKTDLLASRPETYWLDMGDPVRIGDLAERMLTLEAEAGFPRVPIRIVGLRPGEKLHEELSEQGLKMLRTSQPGIWVARQPRIDRPRLQAAVLTLRRQVVRGDAAGALDSLTSLVPDFLVSADAKAAALVQSLGAVSSRPVRASRTA